MWKSLNWVVISSEKNWRLQLDVSISMLWSSSGVTASCIYSTYLPHHAKVQVLAKLSLLILFVFFFILMKYIHNQDPEYQCYKISLNFDPDFSARVPHQAIHHEDVGHVRGDEMVLPQHDPCHELHSPVPGCGVVGRLGDSLQCHTTQSEIVRGSRAYQRYKNLSAKSQFLKMHCPMFFMI